MEPDWVKKLKKESKAERIREFREKEKQVLEKMRIRQLADIQKRIEKLEIKLVELRKIEEGLQQP